MKKLNFIFVMMFAIFTSFAQDVQKETLIVDYFDSSARFNNYSYMPAAIRNGILEGLQTVNRFFVVDAMTEASLQELNANRVVEDEVNVSNVMDENSSAVYKSLGAKYILKGKLTDFAEVVQENPISLATEYKITIQYNLTAYNIENGSTIGSKGFNAIGLSTQSMQESVVDAGKKVQNDIIHFIETNFKIKSTIETIESVDKKNAAKEVYIVGGIELGINKGDKFLVKVEQQIGSRVTRKDIGEVEAVEVLEGVTLCKVTKGGAEISEAHNSGKVVTLESIPGKSGEAGQKVGSFMKNTAKGFFGF